MLAARNASILPLAALFALLRRLASLIRLPGGRGLAESLQLALLERQRYYSTMLGPQTLPRVSPLAVLLVELLRRLFRTLLFTGLFLFLFSPLLSQDFRERLKALKPLPALWDKLRAFFRFCGRLWLRIHHWLRLSRRASVLPADKPTQGSGASGGRRSTARRLSLRKKMQMGRVQRAFAALLRWGTQIGVPYRLFYTPREYAELLADKLTDRIAVAAPDCSSQLAFIVEVFEEAIFSTHLIAAGRLSDYFRAIRLIRHITPVVVGGAGTKLN
jgi:hypothetical protein